MFTDQLNPGQTRVEENRRKSRERQAAENAKQEAELKERQRREAALLPTFDEKMQARLRGITKYASRWNRVGEVARAEKLEVLAGKMTDALAAYRRITAALAVEKQPTPLTDATAKAGKALLKALPGCFDGEAEAVEWAARNLPLTAARAAQNRATDLYVKTANQRTAEQRRFEDVFNEAAHLATGNSNDTALRDVELLGLEF